MQKCQQAYSDGSNEPLYFWPAGVLPAGEGFMDCLKVQGREVVDHETKGESLAR